MSSQAKRSTLLISKDMGLKPVYSDHFILSYEVLIINIGIIF